MNGVKAALFDLDGVLIDTEPLYDKFWIEKKKEYGIEDERFPGILKGVPMFTILERYFSRYGKAVEDKVLADSIAYENRMDFPMINGAVDFLKLLRKHNIKTGLVTSSDDKKLQLVMAKTPLEGMFDTIVTADRITEGKPAPMCYLLAAEDLQVLPEQCLVFEDSFSGIASGNNAGMRVIGLSTTNLEEEIKDSVYRVIPDFSGVTFEKYKEWSL